MTRKLITIVLPLLAPTLVYLSWIYYARRRAARSGVALGEPEAPPWIWLISSGLAFSAIVMVMLVFIFPGADPRSVYVPPYLDESGEVVPGHFEPPE